MVFSRSVVHRGGGGLSVMEDNKANVTWCNAAKLLCRT